MTFSKSSGIILIKVEHQKISFIIRYKILLEKRNIIIDALEFYDTQKRYCEKTNCQNCRIYAACHGTDKNSKVSFVNFIEDWNENNPSMNRKKDLLENYPYAFLSPEGVPFACFKYLDNRYECPSFEGRTCQECRKRYWKD